MSGARAVVTTWLAFCLAVVLAVPQPPNPVHVASGALLGAGMVLAGCAATWRLRRLEPRDTVTRVRLAVLSLLAGAALGALLLGTLFLFARGEPGLRARFASRFGEPLWRPFVLGVESAILEEVVFRLFILSTVAWAVARLRPAWAVTAGVAVSTALFALAHLPAWAAATQLSAGVISGVVFLNSVGALLFAWLFWRWGLPYAILAHFAGDVVIQSLGPRLLA